MSLKSDLRNAATPVGTWARDRFPHASRLYGQLRDAAAGHQVVPDGWGDGRDQRWSWAGTAADTMLRWQLGADGPSPVTQTGLYVAGHGHPPGDDLAGLTAGAPALDDLSHAARVAVLWALAEQHARYGRTDNPLTGRTDQPGDVLLGDIVPADVAADVAALAAGPCADLADTIATWGPVTAGTAYRYPGGADSDLQAGTTLVEVKTTVSKVGLVDVLQPIGYLLLGDGAFDQLAWVFPRSGGHVRLPADEAITAACGSPTPTGTLRGELAALLRG